MSSRVHLMSKKIGRPLMPPLVLLRSAYHRWAEELLYARLVIITAPAGYGKTTFLACAAGLIEQARGTKSVAIVWYSLGKEDSRPAVFLAHLLESIELAVPGLASVTRRILYSVNDPAREYRIIIDQLCEELWQWEEISAGVKILVVLDDYHLVEMDQEIPAILDQLIKDSPPFVHFCISGRKKPAGRFARLSLKYLVRELDLQVLQFSTDEIELLLKSKFNLEISREHAGEIARQTEGWPAGVVITAQTLQNYDVAEYNLILSAALKHRDRIFAYFAEEVLYSQPLELQDFLTQASVIDNLTPQVCQAVLGIGNAEVTLERIYESGLFLSATRQSTGESSYRLHPLFADFLKRVLFRTRGDQYVHNLHRKASDYYRSVSQLDTALEHLWMAGELDHAVSLIKEHAQELLDRGYIEQVRRWLEQVPVSSHKGDPYFDYLRGFIHQHSDHALALDCFSRACSDFATEGKSHLLVRSLIYMCTIFSLQNRVDKLEETSARIPVVSALVKDSWARGVLVVSALCQAAWNDRLARSLWLIKLAQRFSLEPDWQWAMLAYSCMVYYRLGDLDLARRSIEEALTMPLVAENDVWRGMALVLYHVVLYSCDDEVRGELVREQLWEIGERYNSSYYMAYAERARAFPHLHQGNWDRAEELLRSSLYFFNRSGNQAMALITQLDFARLEVSRGNTAQVLESARRSLQELSALHCGQGLVDQGQSLLGLVAREVGELELAEEMLLLSANASKRKGAKQSLAGTQLHLSVLFHLKGDKKRGDSYLERAFSLAQNNNYMVFWDWCRATVLERCQYAITNNICAEYAKRLWEYWFQDEVITTISDSCVSPSVAINISCFGSFELTIDSKAIPPSAWKTRKVLGILKYLILQSRSRVSREQLIEIFWPEAAPESGSASLRVSLSRLRRALDWYAEQGLCAASLLAEGQGCLWFGLERAAIVDVFQFECLVELAKEAMSREEYLAATNFYEQARKLYRGELFADDLYAEWAVSERERYSMLQLELLLMLGQLYSQVPGQRNKLSQVVSCYEEALQINPYREDIYYHLMKTYFNANQKAEALRVYMRCQKMLGTEFGLQPGEELASLAAELHKL